MPGPNVMQRGWFGLRLRDRDSARDISFAKDFMVPALNTGGFDVRPGEFRIFARNVVILFQSEWKRKRATQVFMHWRARGINGYYRKVYWNKLQNVGNAPPGRSLSRLQYQVRPVKDEPDRLIQQRETAEQDESEESEDGEAKEEHVKEEDVKEQVVKQEDVNEEDVMEEGS